MSTACLLTLICLHADLDSWLAKQLSRPELAQKWTEASSAGWHVSKIKAVTAAVALPADQASMQLAIGRELARRQFADEAAAVLEPIRAEEVCDPAALFFFRGGVLQSLGKSNAAVRDFQALAKLEHAPERYKTVARTLSDRLARLDPGTLGGVAHDMREIRRRLEVGKPDLRTRGLQDDVLVRLDKMIEDLDKQCKACKASAGARPNKPADKSMPIPANGKGEVVEGRRLKDLGKWGDLPPKQREKALQDLSKDLPANYRDAVEEYFKRIADESGSDRT